MREHTHTHTHAPPPQHTQIHTHTHTHNRKHTHNDNHTQSHTITQSHNHTQSHNNYTQLHNHTSLQIDLNQARATVDADKKLILDYIVKGKAESVEGRDQQLQFLSNTLKLFFILDPLDFKMDLQQTAHLQEEGVGGSAQGQQQQQQPGSISNPLFDLSAYSAWLSLDPGHANYRCLAVYGGAGSGAGGQGRGGWAHSLCINGHIHVVIIPHCSRGHGRTASCAHTHIHACPQAHHLRSSICAHIVVRFTCSVLFTD